jgi:dTDP-4-dehydrorhamnose reductase
MKIIITGANGMLGGSLCQLYNDKHKVYALHRDKECFTACSADYSLDLADTSIVGAVFNQINPDLVIHCAGLTSVDRCERETELALEENVTTSENVARLSSNKTKLVYISTDQVYGETLDHSETNKRLTPVNEYGKGKLLGEEKVRGLSQNYIIIRTNIFGWNNKPGRVSFAEWVYNSLKNRKKITLFTDYTFSPIFSSCLGEIILKLVENEFIGVINVGSSAPCSKYEFGIGLAEKLGFEQGLISKGSVRIHPLSAKRPPRLDLDVGKVLKMGINIPIWRESIERFLLNEKNTK